MAVVTENDIKTAVKNNNYSRAYYFYGKDTVAVEKYTKALSARLVSKDDETYNLHHFDGKNLDIELLSDSCEALPMFAEYVCCVVSDLNAETLNADQLNAVIDIVKNLPDTTVLIFYYTSVDVTDGKKYPTTKNKKLMDAAGKNGSVCNFALKTSDTLSKEIMAAVSKAGCGISRDAARFLAEQCSCNTMIISNEVAKLTAYAQGNEITMDIIRQLSPRQIETTTFDLAKAIMRMDRKTAMRLFNDLIEEKIEPIVILYTITGNLLDMYRYGCNIANGFHIPDFTEKFFFGIYMIWIFCKEGEKIKFLRGELFFFSVNPYTSCSFVNLNATDFNYIIFHCIASNQAFVT